MINDNLDTMAPNKKIQMSKKIPKFASKETLDMINLRDQLYTQARVSNTPDQWRNYRNTRNRCHKMLTKDKKKFIEKKFEEEKSKDMWDTTKKILDWDKKQSPTILVKNGQAITAPQKIANTLNLQILEKASKTIQKIPKSQVDPLENYSKIMGDKTCTFSIKSISLTDLRKSITTMKASNSAGMDTITSRTIKKLITVLDIPILNMVNSSITTRSYPSNLKLAKIIPLFKTTDPPSSPTNPEAYRGINILMSLGKVIDRLVLKQVLTYLIDNQLISEAHHGAIKGKSTMTAVATIVDQWATLVEEGVPVAGIALDQSAAYDVINHPILLRKMEKIGFQPDTLQWFSSYLDSREQSTYIDGFYSEKLHVGNKSVVQGSVMSCCLYLLYILDIPTIFHIEEHLLKDKDSCKEPTAQTYVDDIISTIRKKVNKSLQESIVEALDKFERYMTANKLALNRQKTQVIVPTRDNDISEKINIPAHPKNIENVRSLKFLGVKIAQNLKWSAFLVEGKSSLYSQLQTRLSALKKIRKFIPLKFAKVLANSIFMGKLIYGAEVWGGAPNILKKKFQSLQLDVARNMIGPKSFRWSTQQLLAEMDWLSIDSILTYTSVKMTYKILHQGKPELLRYRMIEAYPPTTVRTRLSGPNKIGPRPRNIGRTLITRNQFRSKAYHYYAKLPENIQNLAQLDHFTKWTKKFLKYGAENPNDKLPRFLDTSTDDLDQPHLHHTTPHLQSSPMN